MSSTATPTTAWEDSTIPERIVKQMSFRKQYSLKERREMFNKDFVAQKQRSDAQTDNVWRLPLVIEPRDRRKLPYATTRVRYTLKETLEMRRLVHYIATKLAFSRDPSRQHEDDAGPIKPRESIFCFVKYQRDGPTTNGESEPKTQTVMVPTSQTMSEVYRDYADRDGFLYIEYDTENVFG
jgi:hypothetical protein